MFAKDGFDDIGDGAFFIAPFGKGVNAAADEDEVLVANEFVVDGLDIDVAIVEFGGGDFVGDVVEVERFFFTFENEEDFVAEGSWVDVAPFAEADIVVAEEFEAFVDFDEGFDFYDVEIDFAEDGAEVAVDFSEVFGVAVFLELVDEVVGGEFEVVFGDGFFS